MRSALLVHREIGEIPSHISLPELPELPVNSNLMTRSKQLPINICPVDVDATKWSGEGVFTATLLEQLKMVPSIEFIRVEDAPASHTEANYSFISNEVYVRFRHERATVPARWLGILPTRRSVSTPVMTLGGLERDLAAMAQIGAPDYSDEAMLQYLRAERIIPPYQTRGYKMVELVRIYRLSA